MENPLIKRACEAVGGNAKLARAVGVKPPTVQQWLNEDRPVPIGRMTKIEVATNGAVTRKDFRPNDWQEIWPELATQSSRNNRRSGADRRGGASNA